jgi:hypothetical protein
VEAAIGIGSIVIVLVCCLAALSCLVAALRVADAAGEAARLAARGDRAAAEAAVAVLAPSGATLDVTTGGSALTAAVSAEPLGGFLPGLRLHAVAVAALEPEGGGP